MFLLIFHSCHSSAGRVLQVEETQALSPRHRRRALISSAVSGCTAHHFLPWQKSSLRRMLFSLAAHRSRGHRGTHPNRARATTISQYERLVHPITLQLSISYCSFFRSMALWKHAEEAWKSLHIRHRATRHIESVVPGSSDHHAIVKGDMINMSTWNLVPWKQKRELEQAKHRAKL